MVGAPSGFGAFSIFRFVAIARAQKPKTEPKIGAKTFKTNPKGG